jgi:RNA polymerase sigma factor (sigma-70 family)
VSVSIPVGASLEVLHRYTKEANGPGRMGLRIELNRQDTPINISRREGFQMTQPEEMQHIAEEDVLSPTNSHLRFNTDKGKCDDALSAFLDVRRHLFGMAYRMVGCSAEAEDIVQEVWLRWQTANHGAVLNPPAFLMTTTIRMCINFYQSARPRRESYVGEWLLEPVDMRADPALSAERREALRSAVLILLEKLRPRERAAFILREAFDYSYHKIADILRMKEPNVRQLLTRARKRISAEHRATVRPTEGRRLLKAFVDAAQGGRLAELEGILVSDTMSYAHSV